MMTTFRKTTFLLFVPVFLTLYSCAARIEGSLSANETAVLSVNVSLEKGMASLIQRVTTIGGQPGAKPNAQVLDGASISKSMSASPGIASANFKNTSPSAIEGQMRVSKIGDFLSSSNNRGFITFTKGQGSSGKCRININRYDGPKILELFSPEISDYLNALMAPIATGEDMNKKEYLELVTLFYNKQISDEIASSKINATIEFPGNINSVHGGTFSGKKAVFIIPLIDLLVLETPLIYEVSWN